MRKYLLIVIALALVTGCNSGKKSSEDENIKKDSNVVVTVTPPDQPSGKIDIENFGPLKLGQDLVETQKAIGPPGAKANAVEWAADGMLHEDWSWYSYGLILNISSEVKSKDTNKKIFTITASAPCEFKTKAGLGIGNTYAEVQAAYHRNIDPEATDKTQITVGSVYGGIIFSFTNDKVSKVFLGAQAE